MAQLGIQPALEFVQNRWMREPQAFVNQIVKRIARKVTTEILANQLRRVIRSPCRLGTDVRCDNHVWKTPERTRLRQRFDVRYIQTSPAR